MFDQTGYLACGRQIYNTRFGIEMIAGNAVDVGDISLRL